MDRDEHEMDNYYAKLGRDTPVKTPADLAVFETRIKYEAKEGVSLKKIVEHFWQASRAVSMIQKINKFSNDSHTKAANKFMARRLSGLHDLFLSGEQVATNEDLERIMATQMRLQTVPTSQLMIYWTYQSLSQIDNLSDDWFKANFDHFVKLGIYPQDEFITAWWERTESRIHEFTGVEQFSLLDKMAKLDFLRSVDHGEIYADVPSPCRAIAEHLFSIIKPQAKTIFADTINNQVFFAGLWFDKDFVRGIPIAGDDRFQASEFEKKVAHSISETSIRVSGSGIIIPVTGHKVDLRLDHKGQIFGCEVDGISHFNRIAGATLTENAVIYNTSTRFHSALMAKYLSGINILRVPYFLFDKAQKAIHWEKALDRIDRKDCNGIYVWHGDSKSYDLQVKKTAHLFRECDL